VNALQQTQAAGQRMSMIKRLVTCMLFAHLWTGPLEAQLEPGTFRVTLSGDVEAVYEGCAVGAGNGSTIHVFLLLGDVEEVEFGIERLDPEKERFAFSRLPGLTAGPTTPEWRRRGDAYGQVFVEEEIATIFRGELQLDFIGTTEIRGKVRGAFESWLYFTSPSMVGEIEGAFHVRLNPELGRRMQLGGPDGYRLSSFCGA